MSLIRAIEKENEKEAKELIFQSIGLNHKNKHGKTALMIATLQFNSKIVQLLICNQNLRINQRSKKGNTALMLASYDGNSEIVKLLLTHENINIDLRNADGSTALMIAVDRKYFDIVLLLLQCDKSVCYYKNKMILRSSMFSRAIYADLIALMNQNKILICAVCEVNTELVQALLQLDGLDINATDWDGNTALMLASNRRYCSDIFKALLNKPGIDVNTTNKAQESLLDRAFNCYDIEKLLLLIENTKVNITRITSNTIQELLDDPKDKINEFTDIKMKILEEVAIELQQQKLITKERENKMKQRVASYNYKKSIVLVNRSTRLYLFRIRSSLKWRSRKSFLFFLNWSGCLKEASYQKESKPQVHSVLHIQELQSIIMSYLNESCNGLLC